MVATDNSYANRIEALFYSKSDEKFTVRGLLEEILGSRRFEKTLDVGPGPGHITEPLARRSAKISLVEKQPQFQELLTTQFENADVIIDSIESISLDAKYDVILFSHVLYYHPESTWLQLLQHLQSMLNPEGELLLILNSDCGDWWKIVHTFQDELKEHIGFHYIPLSQLKKELASLGSIQSVPYRYQVWIEPGATWCNFVARQMLELGDEDVIAEYNDRFAQMSASFKQIDSSIVLDFRGEILRIGGR